MPHQVDECGYPLDPELRRLEFYIGDLAAKWRGCATLECRDRIFREYHMTMKKLYDLGWDSSLDIESELPNEFLPEEYLLRTRMQHPKG